MTAYNTVLSITLLTHRVKLN